MTAGVPPDAELSSVSYSFRGGARAEGLRIESAGGAWQGTATGATLPDGASANGPLVLTGEGAYEGLTAVLVWIKGSCFFDFRGIVMEFPDPPVPATTE